MEISKYSAINGINGYFLYMNSLIFEDWGALRSVDSYYKNKVGKPFEILKNISEGRLEVQCYGNGYYLGEVNSSHARHGYGMYVWRRDENDRDFSIYIGTWKNNDRDGNGTFFCSEGDETEWYISWQEYVNDKGKTIFQLSYRGLWS